jgi:exopolyphosphatase / guanosine-5'-triphosphate,3'-diphosphate pyrophosphatase
MDSAVRQLAVIDVGTTAIRLAVAEVGADGVPRILEQPRQNVALGDDVFTHGEIAPRTIETCVEVLRKFSRHLEQEYRIQLDPKHVRIVATSAVREATNRETFVDRIYVATGLDIQVVEEAERSRYTYLSVQPFRRSPIFAAGVLTLVVEVGGGSTEVLALRDGKVTFSQEHRLGALRLWQLREAVGASGRTRREVMEAHIERFASLVKSDFAAPSRRTVQILAIGGDARLAASQLQPGWEARGLVGLPVKGVAKVAEEVLAQSEDDLVRRYSLSYPEAETLGAALLTYVRLAQTLRRQFLYVTTVSMRDGVLADLAGPVDVDEVFGQQIRHAAEALAVKYGEDMAHARHVANACLVLYDALQEQHRLDRRHRLILEVAALLHEIGMFVNTRSHHKHSMYLICNSDIFGLNTWDRELAALVARYHRRSHPLMTHELYGTLSRDRRLTVCKLSAILRVADALERSHSQRVRLERVDRVGGDLQVQVTGVADPALERLALEQKAALFAEVYGQKVVVCPWRG